MRLIQLYLLFITLTNIIFIVMNIQYLVFLRKKTITPVEAEELFLAYGKRKVTVEGTFVGLIEKNGKDLVSDRQNTLNNSISLFLNKRPIYVLSDLDRISYGEVVRITGIIEFIGNDFVIHNISIISVLRRELVTRYLNRRYSKAAVYSIIIMIFMEVVRYAYL